MKKYDLPKFIAKCGASVVGSVSQEGFPYIKAMLPPRKVDGDTLYFTTNTSSMRVAQYRDNPKASVYFFQKGRFSNRGVMLVGYMEVLTDDATKCSIWRAGDTIYYPQGVTDPDYCVLKFTAKRYRTFCCDFNVDLEKF